MYKEITAPALEPVSTTELKAWLRITHSDQDTMLAAIITAARIRAEKYLNRRLISTVLEMYLDEFPDDGSDIKIHRCPVLGISHIKYYNTSNVLTTWPYQDYYEYTVGTYRPEDLTPESVALFEIPLFHGAASIVVSEFDVSTKIVTAEGFDGGGTSLGEYTGRIAYLNGTIEYEYSLTREPAVIRPRVNYTYPSTYDRLDAVTIRFSAGYGTAASDVPQLIRTAILMIAANMYEYPHETITGTIVQDIPQGALTLLNEFRLSSMFQW